MRDLAFLVLSFASSAWRWWVAQVAPCVPQFLRAAAAIRGGQLLLIVDAAGHGEFVREDGRRRESLGAVDLSAPEPAAIGDCLATLPQQTLRTLALRLPAAFALRTELSLPFAVERNLAQIVALEIPRRTPFRSEDTYHAFRILKRNGRARQLAVELWVAPRQRVEAMLAASRQATLAPCAVEIAGPDGIASPDLLPARAPSLGRRLATLVPAGLAAAALALGAAALAMPVYAEHREAELLAEQLARARRAAAESVHVAKEIEARRRERGFLTDRKLRAPTVTELLAKLTAALPDDTWLTTLDIRDGEVELTGLSASASTVLSLIDNAPGFAKASFRAPVIQDRQTGRERFDILAHIARETGG